MQPQPARPIDDSIYALVVGKTIERLREAREPKLTQTDLARAAGINQSKLSRIERGESQPSPVALRRIADALSVTVPELTAHFEKALDETEKAAKKLVKNSPSNDWWDATAAVVGVAGLIGLIAFGVGAALGALRK